MSVRQAHLQYLSSLQVAPRPSMLLFDEPPSDLDAELRVETRYDQVEAMTMATHVALPKRPDAGFDAATGARL